MIFWKVWFPTNAKGAKVNGYIKYIHGAIVTISLVLSLIPVGTALGTGGFVISVFPAYLNYCYPRNAASLFYSFILPFCITLPIGSTFNLFTLWKVINIKKHTLNKVSSLVSYDDKKYDHYKLTFNEYRMISLELKASFWFSFFILPLLLP